MNGFTPQSVTASVQTNGARSFTRTGTAEVDFDGSPTAYGPNGAGDDYLANAGHPGRWWGVETGSNGAPRVNPENGHYISTTAWQQGSGQQSSYVDAQRVPYVAMNAGDKARGAKNGDFVLLTNQSTGKQVWAVVADYAGNHPDNHTEVSAAAARALGLSFNKRGVDGHLSMQFFPGTGTGVFPRDADADYIAMGPPSLQSNTQLASASHAATVTGLAGGNITAAAVAPRFNSMASSATATPAVSTIYRPVPALALAA